MKDDYDMGNATMFDTHEFVTEMTAADMPTKQAELLAKTYANLLNDRIATKQDIGILKKDIESVRKDMDSLRTELKGDIESLRTEVKADMKALESRLWAKMIGLQLTTIVILIAYLNYLN